MGFETRNILHHKLSLNEPVIREFGLKGPGG